MFSSFFLFVFSFDFFIFLILFFDLFEFSLLFFEHGQDSSKTMTTLTEDASNKCWASGPAGMSGGVMTPRKKHRKSDRAAGFYLSFLEAVGVTCFGHGDEGGLTLQPVSTDWELAESAFLRAGASVSTSDLVRLGFQWLSRGHCKECVCVTRLDTDTCRQCTR